MTRETRETRPTKETRAHTPRPARAVAEAIDGRPARTPMALKNDASGAERAKKKRKPDHQTRVAVDV